MDSNRLSETGNKPFSNAVVLRCCDAKSSANVCRACLEEETREK